MQHQESFIIFLTWVSGAGKTTMMQRLLEEYSELQQVLSVTTRSPREGEKNGQDYHFVELEQFENWQSAWLFLETALVHNSYYYGTRLDWLLESLEQGHYPIKNIDPIGMEKVEQSGALSGRYKAIFMDISEELMTQRILKRQPDIAQEELLKRLASAQHEREIAHRLSDCIVLDATPEKDVVFARLNELLAIEQ